MDAIGMPVVLSPWMDVDIGGKQVCIMGAIAKFDDRVKQI